ncbi:hypothetical protein [Sporosarcina koreensis]|uniref:Uncharacterized protein n=1 Tax=Sporosarcina koreensis TaxID=334735 RepID=A0ABW0TV69_9BACL
MAYMLSVRNMTMMVMNVLMVMLVAMVATLVAVLMAMLAAMLVAMLVPAMNFFCISHIYPPFSKTLSRVC